MADTDKISKFLQEKLREENLIEVKATTAAIWLDDAGLLKDDKQRPGRNLRQLCRENRILGQIQRPPAKNGNWFIQNTCFEG
jgi:hypothetical protein